jgi:hypothetical protein
MGLETPLRKDYPRFVPARSSDLDDCRVAIADLLASLELAGTPTIHFSVANAPLCRDVTPMELGVLPIGSFTDKSSQFRTVGPAQVLVFEVAAFPRDRCIPVNAWVVSLVRKADDGSPLSCTDPERQALEAMAGKKLRALKSAPGSIRALRRSPNRDMQPAIVVGTFAELGLRAEGAVTTEDVERTCWFVLKKNNALITLFSKIAEGPMNQATSNTLMAMLRRTAKEQPKRLHAALGPDEALVFGFHSTATFEEIVGQFEEDNFALKPIPRLDETSN